MSRAAGTVILLKGRERCLRRRKMLESELQEEKKGIRSYFLINDKVFSLSHFTCFCTSLSFVLVGI
jgi:hypothetical protein